MKNSRYIILSILLLAVGLLKGQNNHLYVQVTVDSVNQTLKVYQKLNYFNNSDRDLHQLCFHDWNHAYSDKNSNLGKRFIENYNQKFYFTSVKNRGYTKIDSIRSNGENLTWKREKNAIDQLAVLFNQTILQESYTGIEFWYTLKLPHKKFTGYGYDKNGYHLKNWLIVPVVYDQGWQLMSNLDMNDQYLQPADFNIIINIPSQFEVHSNLQVENESPGLYRLSGKSLMDFELVLNRPHTFQTFSIDSLEIDTDLDKISIEKELKNNLLQRQITFLKENLGDNLHPKFLITQTQYDKNPLYGFNQLPGFLRPFPDSFEWDLRMFQTLSKTYIDQNIFSNTRQNVWLREGLPHYLMLKYLETYYPDEKLIGNISNIWGIKTYYISKMNFTDRYLLGYQYVARKNIDQSLVTPTDSLTNYNRSVANPFKTALGLKYLEEYTDYNTVKQSVKDYFRANTMQKTKEDVFKNTLYSLATKKLDWFFDEYVNSDTDFDFTIHDLHKTKDSIRFSVKKGNSQLPIPIYGIRQNGLTGVYWFQPKDSLQTFQIPNQNEKQVMINYKGIIPEINLKNNWKKTENHLFGKPLSIRWLSDAEDPYHTQIFVEPNIYYNYYDGFTIANIFSNRTILKQKVEYRFAPSYGFKSNSLSGSFYIKYVKYFRDSKFNNFYGGISGNYFHYKPELTYTAFSTYGQLIFKRKNLRAVDGKALTASYTLVQKDMDETNPSLKEANQYGIVNLNFSYSNPALINSFHFSSNIEYSSKFSKLYTELGFRRLINNNQQFGVRLFLGTFLHNDSDSDFFSYGINRPYDYLFRYNYFGRFESTGFLSQQFILNDGGFISEMPVQFSNQWLASINTSIGLWKWVELYNNVGLTKSKGQATYFLHDKGVRLNFINGMLEVYLPLHSNNGWETTTPHYEEKIRFVLTAQLREIVNYLKRGVM